MYNMNKDIRYINVRRANIPNIYACMFKTYDLQPQTCLKKFYISML